MKKIYLFTLAVFSLSSCKKEPQELVAQKTVKPQSELEQKAGWLLGKWEKVGEKSALYSHWKKLDDSTFVEQGTIQLAMMPKEFEQGKTTVYLQLRKGVIWKISDEGEKKWRDSLIAHSPNSLTFKSLDEIDTETWTNHKDSMTMAHVYKHDIKQKFVLQRAKKQ